MIDEILSSLSLQSLHRKEDEQDGRLVTSTRNMAPPFDPLPSPKRYQGAPMIHKIFQVMKYNVAPDSEEVKSGGLLYFPGTTEHCGKGCDDGLLHTMLHHPVLHFGFPANHFENPEDFQKPLGLFVKKSDHRSSLGSSSHALDGTEDPIFITALPPSDCRLEAHRVPALNYFRYPGV
ncbi:hypothetical protein KIN20_018828 [Parelaphostrongylus tenuis]|uniref:Uncharacterized protein n=1 Tax=Parelaphostrongylus tenuis TaxID=148309 RepID=A0AAD5QRV3_PARTN|nr:hypothetical protein KIN20_018828 [Parelaphostrongylus tenuis]